MNAFHGLPNMLIVTQPDVKHNGSEDNCFGQKVFKWWLIRISIQKFVKYTSHSSALFCCISAAKAWDRGWKWTKRPLHQYEANRKIFVEHLLSCLEGPLLLLVTKNSRFWGSSGECPSLVSGNHSSQLTLYLRLETEYRDISTLSFSAREWKALATTTCFTDHKVNDNTGKQILNSQLIPTFTDYRGNSLVPIIHDLFLFLGLPLNDNLPFSVVSALSPGSFPALYLSRHLK